MNPAASSCNTKMPRTKGKSSGWAAFDLKQRQKQGLESEIDEVPFPPISSSFTPVDTRGKSRKDHEASEKSFSSMLMSPLDFPSLIKNNDCRNQGNSGSSSSKSNTSIVQENGHDLAFKKLKEMNSWADDSLIRDILLATDDNVDMASDFLRGIVSAGNSEENNDNNMKTEELRSKMDGFSSNNRRAEKAVYEKTVTASLGKTASSTYKDALKEDLQDSGKSLSLVNAAYGKKLSDDISNIDMVIRHLQSIPIEPEWEEDDLYLSHRKDALKMMRSASYHSRAATNAFSRGDHSSAKQHSEKARADWLAAERLNAEAAKEILSIINRNNDLWKLDLHGLHATEAIQALRERLQSIEGQVKVNRSVSPHRGRANNRVVRSASQESFGSLDVERVDKQRISSRQLQNSLQVITGIGNHSRGQASLPIAVKRFLEDNGYRFDETRAGIITVRPKFRNS